MKYLIIKEKETFELFNCKKLRRETIHFCNEFQMEKNYKIHKLYIILQRTIM